MGNRLIVIINCFLLISLFSCSQDNEDNSSVKFNNQEYNFHLNKRIKVIHHKDTADNYFEFTSFDTIGKISYYENGVYANKDYDYRNFLYKNKTKYDKLHKPIEYHFGSESKPTYNVEYSKKDDLIKSVSGSIFSFYRYPRTLKKGELLNVLFFIPNPPNVNRDFEVILKDGNVNDKLNSAISENGNVLNIYDSGLSKTKGVKDLDIICEISDAIGIRDSSIFSLRVIVE